MIRDIVDQVYQATGRFVKRNPNDDRWYEIDHAHARDKVGHIFRDSLRQQKHKKKRKGETDNLTSTTMGSPDKPVKEGSSKKTPANKKMKTATTATMKVTSKASSQAKKSDPAINPKSNQKICASQNSIFRGMNMYCAQRTGSIVGGVQDMKCFPDHATSASSPPSLLNLLVPL